MAELPLPEAARARPAGPLARLRTAPTTSGLALLAALLAGYAGAITMADALAGLVDPEAPLHLLQIFRFNLVLSVLVAFTAWARLVERPSIAADLAAVRPELDLAPPAFEERLRHALDDRRPALLGGLAGAAFGACVPILSHRAQRGSFEGWGWDVHDWWLFGSMMLLFGLMGTNAAASFRTMGVFRELGRHARVRLLAPESLRIFGRRGLRWSRFWFIGSALAILLVLNTARPGIVLAIIGGTLVFGAAALLIPCLGVHRRLREVKRAELARVRETIERKSTALLEGRRAAADDPDVPALLAYESRIQAVSEWPFDVPLLIRFSLLVMIPLGSWVGGAMVERLVDAALE